MSSNLTPQVTRKYNVNLDVLRGAAASIVMMRHLISYDTIFDKNFTIKSFVVYNPPAHLAVLVFFILSGYVIGLNHPTISSGTELKDYIKKRLLRIIPIYFVVVLASVLLLNPGTELAVVLANLCFISVPMDNVLNEVSTIWSLYYEMLYYFVYIAFAWFRINLFKTVIGGLIIIAGMFAAFHNVRINPLLTSMLIGFIFWITGAYIATVKTWKEWPLTSSRMIGIFLLILSIGSFNPYGPILKLLHVRLADYSSLSWFQQSISYDDLFFYPYTVLLIFVLTNAYSRLNSMLLWLTFGLSFARLFMIIYMYGFAYLQKEHLALPASLLSISLLLWVLNFNVHERVKHMIKATAPLSKISYALYLAHLPMLFIFAKLPASGSVVLFILKVLAYIISVMIVSYLLELHFQPFVKRLFYRKK